MPTPSEPFPQSLPLDGQGLRLLAPAHAAEIAASFDLTRLPAGFHADPYPVYHALRMHAPVHRMPSGGCVLSRHADLEAVYKDTATFSSDKKRRVRPQVRRQPAL